MHLFMLAVALLPVLQADPPGFVLWSALELAQRDTALSRRVGLDHSARAALVDYGTPSGAHRVRFIHRDADGRPGQHAHIEDVVYIQSGEGTLQVGGEMVDRTGCNDEYTGTGIAGGARYAVGTGDILRIPADTPHRYLVPDGGHITYVLVRVPAFIEG